MPLSRAERCLIRGINWIPVLVMHLIAGWSYYAYVVKLCLGTVQDAGERVGYLVVYHVLFVMLMWSCWRTTFTRPAAPPKTFRLPKEDAEQFQKAAAAAEQHDILRRLAGELPVLTQTPGGAVRYCDFCHVIKPDRCHHCFACETCVLKRDHHCPWVNNCVGFSNHKYFVLFLAYGILYCLAVAATSLPYCVAFATERLPASDAKLHVMLLCPVAVVFFAGYLGFFTFHTWLLGKNRTTTEIYGVPVFRGGPDRDGFSLGLRRNVAEVFGDRRVCWPCPVFSSLGDGQSFGIRLDLVDPEQGVASGQQQQQQQQQQQWLGGGEEV